MDFDSGVTGVLFLERGAPQVTDAESGGAQENQFVFENVRRDGAAHDIPHGVVRVTVIRTGVVDEHCPVVPWPEFPGAELNTLQSTL